MTSALSASAYGRRRGVSHVAVLKAIETGRLQKSVTRPSPKKILIDAELADQEWEGNTDPAQQREKEAAEFLPGSAGEQGELFKRPKDDRATQEQNRTSGATMAKARAMKETFLARLAQLSFEEKTKKLVSRNTVEAEAFSLARKLRDALLLIPARVVPRLASAKDLAEMEDLLRAEIIKTLEGVSGDAGV